MLAGFGNLRIFENVRVLDLLERATIVPHDNDRRYDRGSVLNSEVTNGIGT